MEKVIERLDKLKGLVKEYQISKESENYDYVMKREYQSMGLIYYSLLERKSGEVKLDTYDRLVSWLKIRNVDSVRIYLANN